MPRAAAEMGLLRHYTAWAVALGELDHWKKSGGCRNVHPRLRYQSFERRLPLRHDGPGFVLGHGQHLHCAEQ